QCRLAGCRHAREEHALHDITVAFPIGEEAIPTTGTTGPVYLHDTEVRLSDLAAAFRRDGLELLRAPRVPNVRRCRRTDARKWAAQVGSVVTPELVATTQSPPIGPTARPPP